jgi:hypothetical protein
MNKDTEQPIQKDHQITKINRQADVLDQARLRPHIMALSSDILQRFLFSFSKYGA